MLKEQEFYLFKLVQADSGEIDESPFNGKNKTILVSVNYWFELSKFSSYFLEIPNLHAQ